LTLRLAAGPKCERFCIPSLLRHQGISITSRNHAAFFPQLCGILSAIMQSTAFVWVKSVTGQPTVNSLSLPLGPSKQHPESVMAGALIVSEIGDGTSESLDSRQRLPRNVKQALPEPVLIAIESFLPEASRTPTVRARSQWPGA
jgi:hypothetical protein